jgi:hypothetical protein
MSVGIEIYYKLLDTDKDKLLYGYSGANINKEYNEKNLLLYDGLIETEVHALESKSAAEAFKDKNIHIVRECIYEWHQPRLIDGEETVGYFVVRAVSKIFSEFKQNKQPPISGGVVY